MLDSSDEILKKNLKKKKPGRLIRLETQGMKLEGLFRAAIPSCVGVSRKL